MGGGGGGGGGGGRGGGGGGGDQRRESRSTGRGPLILSVRSVLTSSHTPPRLAAEPGTGSTNWPSPPTTPSWHARKSARAATWPWSALAASPTTWRWSSCESEGAGGAVCKKAALRMHRGPGLCEKATWHWHVAQLVQSGRPVPAQRSPPGRLRRAPSTSLECPPGPLRHRLADSNHVIAPWYPSLSA